MAPNRIREERLAAGFTGAVLAEQLGTEPSIWALFERGIIFPSPKQVQKLAETIGVTVELLYPDVWKQALGLEERSGRIDVSAYWDVIRGPQKLLIAPDEVTWTETRPTAASGPIDVYLSLSCGNRALPNVLLDTVSVLGALGVRFVAAAGQGGCCGSPLRKTGFAVPVERWVQTKDEHALSLGARANVNVCPGCQHALGKPAEEGGSELRQVHVLTFLAERLQELGDAVPWKQARPRRVIAECHASWPEAHQELWRANTRLLGMIRGVDLVGTFDGSDAISPCGHRGTGDRSPLFKQTAGPAWRPAITQQEIRERRVRLEERFAAMGVDTVSCTHPGCQFSWSRYATERLHVANTVSILADALGCSHPDRYQAAARLADPAAVVNQTRPLWSAWGMSEDEAHTLASDLADPRYGDGLASCGDGVCGDDIVTVDVLSGTVHR